MLARGNLAGKHCARARGLSKCGGMQDNLFVVPAANREMSLGSDGKDREIYRAQRLFCHRAKEQLAYLASAPGAKKYTTNLELAYRGGNLLGGIPLSHQNVANHLLLGRNRPPCLQCFCCIFKRASRVVVRHSYGVDVDACAWSEHVKEN